MAMNCSAPYQTLHKLCEGKDDDVNTANVLLDKVHTQDDA